MLLAVLATIAGPSLSPWLGHDRYVEVGRVVFLFEISEPIRPEIQAMRIKYFLDTDTALLEFSDRPVHETSEVNENVYLDLDANGNLVSMTIEHAKARANLPEIYYQQLERGAA